MIPYGNSIKNEDMPKPDTRVRYSDNMFGPAMFHYLPEYAAPTETAKEHGFDILFVRMTDQLDEDHPLYRLYFDQGQCASVFAAWHPTAPDGWKISGCYDTEDGPTAIYLRPVAIADSSPAKPPPHPNAEPTRSEDEMMTTDEEALAGAMNVLQRIADTALAGFKDSIDPDEALSSINNLARDTIDALGNRRLSAALTGKDG